MRRDQGWDGTDSPAGSLQVIQAAESTAALDVLVDGQVVINGLAAGTVSPAVRVAPGQRNVAFGRQVAHESAPVFSLHRLADSNYTAIVIDSSAVLNPAVLTDSGGIPAAGKTKLQVANFASLGRPDRRLPPPARLRRLGRSHVPVCLPRSSGYVQSDPGDWQVLVASESRVNGVPPDVPQDTLLVVQPVSLAAGQAATVVLLDGGGIDAVLIRDR